MPQIQQLLAPNGISYDYNSPEWVVVHYTATTASAYNNAVYFSRGGSWSSSAHFFVDGGDIIYQSVPIWRGAWHAGNYDANTHSIGIEVVSAGEDFSESEISNLAWLVQNLMEEHGIPADRVIRHYDVADCFGGYTLDPNKHCPAPYVNRDKWIALKERITEGDDMASAHDMWTYKNEKVNGDKDAYKLLTEINQAVSYGGLASWGYKNEKINGDADTYKLLTEVRNEVAELTEAVKALVGVLSPE